MLVRYDWPNILVKVLSIMLVLCITVIPFSIAYAAKTEGVASSSSRVTGWTPSHDYSTAGLDAIISHFSLKGQTATYWSYLQTDKDYKSDQEFSAIKMIFSGKSGKKLYDTSNTSKLLNQAGLSGSNLSTAKSWVDSMGSTTNKRLVGSNTNFTGSTGKANTWSTANKHRVGDNHYYGYSWYSNSGGLQRECDGFASFIAYCLSGSDTYKAWSKVTDSIKSNSDLRVGDIIRAGGHTAIVYQVKTDKIVFFQACGSSYNKIVIGKFQTTGTPETWSKISKLSPTVWRAKDNTGSAVTSTPTLPPTATPAVGEFETMDSTLRIGISIKKKTGNTNDDQCYIKDTPYEAGTTVDVIAKGDTIDIVGAVKNKHGNTWYKTSDGNYVYSGDVTVYAYGNLFNISTTFKNTEKRESHVAPYLDSPGVNTIKKNDTVTVTKFVVNEKGNIWTKLSDDSYLCFYDVDTKENKLTFLDTDISTSSVTKPTGDIPLKKSFGLRGTITADAPILSVTAQVTNRSTGKVAVGPVTANVSAYNSYVNSLTLNKTVNGTNINDKMGFSKLSVAGYYRYEVIVQLGFPYVYDGHTFIFGEEQIVISSDFTAGSPDEEELLPDVPVEPTPDPMRMAGDANEDAVVDVYDALLILQYDAGWNVSLNTSNADVNADNSVDIYDALLVLQYDAGWNVVLK